MRVQMVKRDARLNGERTNIILSLKIVGACKRSSGSDMCNGLCHQKAHIHEGNQRGAVYLRWEYQGGARFGSTGQRS
jgi:hypothetical protein